LPLAAIWDLIVRGGEGKGGEKGKPPTTLSGYATEGMN